MAYPDNRHDSPQLFSIEQDVDIALISYEDLDQNMSLTAAQMEALLFMIK